jgi:hypothetical protein
VQERQPVDQHVEDVRLTLVHFDIVGAPVSTWLTSQQTEQAAAT